MTLRRTGTVCTALAVLLAVTGGAMAQTSTTGTGTATGTGGLTSAQLSQILQALQSGGGSSSVASLLGSLTGSGSTSGTGNNAATSQPTGRPSAFINNGITEHQAFYNNAFNLTPAQRRAAMTQPVQPVKIPITVILPILSNWLAKEIPALGFLANIFGNVTNTNPGTSGTAPAAKSGEGPVAFVTADDTSLTVGATTTGRLWVQQSSPTTAKDNGIFSVAVNINAAPAGIVQLQVPVTILSTWSKPAVQADTGTATAAGGIDQVTAGVDITKADKSQGTNGPVEVFNFPIKAVAAGTVTLAPKNFLSSGFKGVLDYQSLTGSEANYVSVDITVAP